MEKTLEKCIETNLVLNFEKCHFMVEQGIVLGHIISNKGIEVDPAKISVISQLPFPSCVREVRSFRYFRYICLILFDGLIAFNLLIVLH